VSEHYQHPPRHVEDSVFSDDAPFQSTSTDKLTALRAELAQLRNLAKDCRAFIIQFSGPKSDKLIKRLDAAMSTTDKEGAPQA